MILNFINAVLATTTCNDVKLLYQQNDPACCLPDSSQTEVPYNLLPNDVDATMLGMVYRTGPYSSNGIPYADGFQAYIDHHNTVSNLSKLALKECETAYSTAQIVKCYYEFGNQVSAVMPLATGGVGYLTSSEVSLYTPVTASGYGMGYGPDDYLHFTAPSYNDAITAFMKKQPTGSRVGFIHLPMPYGNQEVAHFQAEATAHGLVSTILNTGYPDDWGGSGNVATWTQQFSEASNQVDALYMMPWGIFGGEWMEAVIAAGYTASQMTTLWWGAPNVMKPEYNGVHVVSFVDPSKSPVALPTSGNSVIAAMGVREAMVFAESVEKAINPTTFVYNGNSGPETHQRKILVTPGALNNAMSNLELSNSVLARLGATGFTNQCFLGDSCELCTCASVSVYTYNNNVLTLA
jgi:hypothetical protein